MLFKLGRYILVLIILFTLVGFGGWVITRWLALNNQIPEGVIKVVGDFKGLRVTM